MGRNIYTCALGSFATVDWPVMVGAFFSPVAGAEYAGGGPTYGHNIRTNFQQHSMFM